MSRQNPEDEVYEEFTLSVKCSVAMDSNSKYYYEELDSLKQEVIKNIMKIDYVENVE